MTGPRVRELRLLAAYIAERGVKDATTRFDELRPAHHELAANVR
jgi:hypothetical protein